MARDSEAEVTKLRKEAASPSEMELYINQGSKFGGNVFDADSWMSVKGRKITLRSLSAEQSCGSYITKTV